MLGLWSSCPWICSGVTYYILSRSDGSEIGPFKYCWMFNNVFLLIFFFLHFFSSVGFYSMYLWMSIYILPPICVNFSTHHAWATKQLQGLAKQQFATCPICLYVSEFRGSKHRYWKLGRFSEHLFFLRHSWFTKLHKFCIPNSLQKQLNVEWIME